MNARETEAALLARCVAATRDVNLIAADPKEANVFVLAGMVLQSRFPSASSNLMQAGERYFANHPASKLAPVDVVRNGWIISLPRLRDMLSVQLRDCA